MADLKRVLIISYHWPPSGSISVLRTLKITKYLRKNGWEPVLYIPSNATYDYLDEEGQNDIPKNLEVLKGPIIEPFDLFRLVTGRQKNEPIDNLLSVKSQNPSYVEKFAIWLRANLFIPDARFLWIRPSVKNLSQYLKRNTIQAIFTDGPPHTNTMIGFHLSKRYNIPWLADFQDPWTQVDYLQEFPLTGWAKKIHERMEAKVFRQASLITIASPRWKTDLEKIGAQNVHVINFGFDEDDFSKLSPQVDNSKFVIFHGGLLGYDRFPKDFFEVLSEIDLECLKNKVLEIRLAGKIDYRIKSFLDDGPLKNSVRYEGFIPRRQVLQHLLNADLLLLPLNKGHNNAGRLPGKLYEYLRSFTPILMFGPENSDAADILKQSKAGFHCDYNDKEKIKTLLIQLMSQTSQPKPNIDYIMKLSNASQTERLAGFLNRISLK